MIGLLVNTSELTPTHFWRLVRWCRTRGANEFYITAWGSDPELVEAMGNDLRARLASFAKDVAPRVIPSHAMWENEEQTVLWHLNDDSMAALRDAGIERHFEPQETPREGEHVGALDAMGPYAVPHYLCLYRRGIPMLAMGEEQGPELTLIVDKDDLEDLAAQHVGIEYEVLEDYFPDLFADRPGRAPN